MREVKVQTIWKNGGAAVNGWLSIPNVYTAEIMANCGWDSITIDMQHGLVGYQEAVNMLTALSTTDVTPFVRVPWMEEGIVMKMLDAGAMGIICPMVNNKAEAERLAAACKYAPQGIRSVGPIRASLYAGGDYFMNANEQTICCAMIETKEAVENMDEIMAVDGIDMVYIGPSDLSLTYGLPPAQNNKDNPTYEAQVKVVAAAKKHGIKAGLHNASSAYAKEMIDLGFDFVTAGSDSGAIARQARLDIATARGES